MNRKAHWDRVYTKPSEEMSWFQPEPTLSLRLLEKSGLTRETCVIDIGGGDSRLVDRLFARGVRCISILDVSAAALARAKARLGRDADVIRWIEADVTGPWTAPTVDIWHDRAVFHFLTDAEDRARYVQRARELIVPGGIIVLASFAPDGPERCSGLPVCRYDAPALAAQLGEGFTLVESLREAHHTPAGKVQPFTYVRLVRTAARRSVHGS